MEIDPARVEEIFNAALDQVDDAARAEYLDQACGDDRPLRQRVEALLAAHLTANNFLDLPGSQIGNTENVALNERPGSQIGPYKLLQQLGEGGMGVVYMAAQTQPVERRVALKIIKPGMDTRQVIARFEAERQALALMDHPHIAKVLDAGTTETGRPYFVMEMVRGVPITEYCDEHQLTPRRRLELFVPVCHAVQHAHQKGIIHRDLKPSNVLVAEYDEQAVAKIIDFGVAKAVGQQLTDKTMFTQVGQLVGTIDYMSPEQAKLNQLDVDTRTDIYSLGVLLYELLTGETPFDHERLHAAALDEMLRIIREEDPPRPSTRLSSSNTLPSAAAKRRTEPKRLATLVRGELDWIVMRCLEKDRTRRYESANGLGMDIQRYLADEPVLACPPSAAYRFNKFARRNRVALLTVAIVSVALVVGTVVSLWQAVRATRAEHLADQRLSAETHARAAEAEQRKAAEAQRSEAENQRELAEVNYQKAKAAVDKYFTLVSESTLLDVPGLQPLRKDLLESSLEFYQGAALERTSDPAVLVDVALSQLRVGSMYFALGQVDDFIGALERALDVVDRMGSQQSPLDDHLPKLAGWFKGSRLAWHQTDQPRDPSRAFQTVSRYLTTWQRFESRYTDEPGFSSDLVSGYGLMAEGLNSAGRKDEALAYLRKARAGGEKLVARYPQAPLYRATLAEVSLSLASPFLPSRPDERMACSRHALELTEGLVAEFPNVPVYRDQLANCLRSVHDQILKAEPRRAEELVRRALDLRESLVREFPGERFFWESWRRERYAWASFEASRGNDSLANQHVQQAIETFEAQIKVRPQDRWLRVDLAIFCQTVAFGLRRQGKLTDLAEQLDRRAIAISAKLSAEFPGDQKVTMDLIELHESAGHSLWPLGRADDAAQHFKACVAVMEKAGRQPGSHYNVERFCSRTIDLARIIAGGARDPEPAGTSRLISLATELLDEKLQDPVRRSFLAAAIRAYCEPLSKEQKVLLAVDRLLSWSNPIVEQTIDNPTIFDKLIADHAAYKWDRIMAADTQKWLARILTWTNRPMEAGDMWLSAIHSCEVIAKDHDDLRVFVKYAQQDFRPHANSLVRQLMDTGELADVERFVRGSMAADPGDPSMRYWLAELFCRYGRFDEAEALLRELTALEHQRAPASQRLARFLVEQRRPEEAQTVIREAVADRSNSPLDNNNLAWFLATCSQSELRNPTLAVEVAQRAIEPVPEAKAAQADAGNQAMFRNTLGVAQYRAGSFEDAIQSLLTAEELTPDRTLAYNGFFLAMAHWQLDHKDEARTWYDKSTKWMEKNQPTSEELIHFRAEAEELLGLVPSGDTPKAGPQSDTAKPPG